MRIKIHRGAHEIGGSCIEIESNSSRIVIDIGVPLVKQDGSRFDLADCTKMTGQEMVGQGILPNIPGFYNWDILNRPVDGLLLSHAHLDHYGFFGYLRDDVCVYLGRAAKFIIELTKLFTPLKGEINKYYFIESGKPFCCGDIRVTPYLMDHSAFDSYAFLVEAGDKSLIYSGDFREHGRKSKAFYWFLNNAPRNVDALLLEGSMFGRDAGCLQTEKDIEDETVKISSMSQSITLFYCSGQNIDRLVSFYRAACRAGKLFVIDVYTAAILDGLKDFAKIPYPNLRKFPNIRVFFPHWLCRRILGAGQQLLSKFEKYRITQDQLSRESRNIMMMIRPSMIIDLEQISNMEGGTFLYSMWSGYLKESASEKLVDYLAGRQIMACMIHTSGHAYVKTLAKVIKTLQPKEVIPIHTFCPEAYRKIASNVRQLPDGEVHKL